MNTKLKLAQYFLGNPTRNVKLTILGFQKNLTETDMDISNDQPTVKNFISYFLVYNHMNCRIDYFLINYGYPFNLKNKSNNEKSAMYDNSRWGSLNFNRIIREYPDKWPNIEEHNTLGEAVDGKLSLNFFKIFLTNVLCANLQGHIHEHIFDLRAIAHLIYLRRVHEFNYEPIILDLGDAIPALNNREVEEVHIQERFNHEKFLTDINTIYRFKLTYVSINKNEEAGCIKDLRRTFHGKSFVDPQDLTEKIIEFNAKQRVKAEHLFRAFKG